MFKISNLKASRDDKQILKGVNLEIKPGEIHALMGPNGSGKSTLAAAVMGHPDITIDEGTVNIDDENLLDMDIDERSLNGLFMAFQYPVEIPGVSYPEFLRIVYNNHKSFKEKDFKPLSKFKFDKLLREKMKELKIDESFLERNLNEGFSGGEKKKSEILQLSIIEPKYAILDETDSGLDVSALKIVAEGAAKISKEKNIGLLVITHYKRILDYLNPDYVHLFIDGQISRSGDSELASQLERDGYDNEI